MATNLELYLQAQSDAKASQDFKTDARRWYNEALQRMALIAKRRGEWHITVSPGTTEYQWTNTAVAVPQFTPSLPPLENGLRFVRLRRSGRTEDVELAFLAETDFTGHGLRLWGDRLFVQPTPNYAGTLKLYGYRTLQQWTSDAQDGLSPDFSEQLHQGLSHYMTAMYWLVRRQRDDMWRTWMDKFDLMLMDLEAQVQRPHQGPRRIRARRFS